MCHRASILIQFNPFWSQYPQAILKFEYDPKLAIRGLHYDIIKGLLLKIDSFIQVLDFPCIQNSNGWTRMFH